MRLKRSLGALAIIVTAIVACQRLTAIWILGQEEPGRPVFGIGDEYRGPPALIATLIVAPCEGFDGTGRKAVWMIQADTVRPLARVTYGRLPPGYAATSYMSEHLDRTAVAPPLSAGCYVAKIDGTGRVFFQVGADGSVLELPRNT